MVAGKFRYAVVVVLMLTLAFVQKWAAAQVMIHAHNDYETEKPLWNALLHGVDYIEADVFPVNGRLLVAHEKEELPDAPYLSELYLKPLHELLSRETTLQSGHTTSATLFIDIKRDHRTTLDILQKELIENSSIVSAGMKIVISGERGPISGWKDAPSYLAFDGRPDESYDSLTLGRVAMISDAYARYADANQDISDKRIRQFVEKARLVGKPCRLWGAPDNPASWKRLVSLGINIINTDHVAEARSIFSKKLLPVSGSR